MALRAMAAFIILMCMSGPAGSARAQVTDSRNLMWCSAKSDKTFYYSAWFHYTEGRMDAHAAKFRKDTLANYSLKSLDVPSCHSYPEASTASDAFDVSVKGQKKAGFQVVTTGWMPD